MAPPTNTEPLNAALAAELGSEFELGNIVGSGGFAVVYRARDHVLHRDVAVKILNPAVTLDEKAETRFRHEAQLIAGLEHPNIVPVYSAGMAGRVPYILMRFVVGRSLEQVLEERRSEPLPWVEATRIALQAADALAYAHTRGVIHLDIKPGNLLLDQMQNVLVADFGIARVMAAESAPATPRLAPPTGGAAYSTVSGTARYMSPEQALGETVDSRADVYALGVVLHQMLTGRVPFDAPSVPATLKQQLDTDFRFLDAPAIPPGLRPILRRALAPSPNDRFADAGELRDAIAAFRTSMASRSARRRVGVVVGVLATLATASVLLWMAVSRDQLARRSPALDAVGNIPDSLVQELRALGALDSGEVVRYVFAPAGSSARDAFVLTDRRAMRLTGGVPRAHPLASLRGVAMTRMRGGRNAVILWVSRPGASANIGDTLFTGLGDRERASLNEKLIVFQFAK